MMMILKMLMMMMTINVFVQSQTITITSVNNKETTDIRTTIGEMGSELYGENGCRNGRSEDPDVYPDACPEVCYTLTFCKWLICSISFFLLFLLFLFFIYSSNAKSALVMGLHVIPHAQFIILELIHVIALVHKRLIFAGLLTLLAAAPICSTIKNSVSQKP